MFKNEEIKRMVQVVLFLEICKKKEKYLAKMWIETGESERLLVNDVSITLEESFWDDLENYEIWRQGKTSKYDPRFPGTLKKQIELENQIGHSIFQNFFVGEINKSFIFFIELLQSKKIHRLFLTISSCEPEILNIPFEMISKAPNSTPFSVENDHFLVIHTTVKGIADFTLNKIDPITPPLKILYVSSLPEDLGEGAKFIELEKEQEKLLESLGNLISEKKVLVEFLELGSLVEIEKALAIGHHHIVHISGHGKFLNHTTHREGILYLEKEDGNTDIVHAVELAEVLKKYNSVNLVMLSACETGRIDEFGVAGALIKGGIPVVLGMHYTINDAAATIFTSAFYAGICRGTDLCVSLSKARKKVIKWHKKQIAERQNNSNFEPFPSEWFNPFLYFNQMVKQFVYHSRKSVDVGYFFKKPVSFVDGGKYVGKGFIGRRKEILKLSRLFNKGKHAVCIYGPGGIGKTTLAIRFADNFESGSYKIIQFKGEVNEETILKKLAEEVKNKVGKEIVELVDSPNYSPEEKLDILIEKYLSKEKLIVLFDNFEANQMESKENMVFQPELHSETLKKFLTYFCQKLNKSFYLLFTTRYLFSIPPVAGLNLNEMNFSDTFKLINQYEYLVQLSLQEKRDIHKKIGGHPRTLELLESNLENCEVNWKTIYQKLKNVKDIEINHDLLLNMLWDKLTQEEKHVFKAASIFRKIVPLEGLEKATKFDKEKLKTVVNRLNNLSLVFTEGEEFYVHRLTAFYVKNNQMGTEEKNHYNKRAVDYFLHRDIIDIVDGVHIKSISDGMEVLWHYLQGEDYDQATKISLSMGSYLFQVGYIPMSFELIREIHRYIDGVNEENQAKIYGKLGILNTHFGNYDTSLSYFGKSGDIWEKLNNTEEIASNLFNIGTVYQYKNDDNTALKYYEKAEKFFCKTNNTKVRSTLLLNTGAIYQRKNDLSNALKKFENAHEIYETICDTDGIAACLHNIGVIFQEKGDYDKSMQYYLSAVEDYEKKSNVMGISDCYYQIGKLHKDRENYSESEEYLKKSLHIKEKILDNRGILRILDQMGEIRELVGDPDMALAYYEKYLNFIDNIGKNDVDPAILGHIGLLYQDSGNFKKALKLFNKSLDISRQIGNLNSIAASLHNIGSTYQDIGDNDSALCFYENAMEEFKGICDWNNASKSLSQILQIHQERHNLDEIISYLKGNLIIYEQLGDSRKMSAALAHLGDLLSKKLDFIAALNYFIRAYLMTSPSDEKILGLLERDISRLKSKISEAQFSEILKRWNVDPEDLFFLEDEKNDEQAVDLSEITIEAITAGENRKQIKEKLNEFLLSFENFPGEEHDTYGIKPYFQMLAAYVNGENTEVYRDRIFPELLNFFDETLALHQ